MKKYLLYFRTPPKNLIRLQLMQLVFNTGVDYGVKKIRRLVNFQKNAQKRSKNYLQE